MIKEVKFKFGRINDQIPLKFQPGSITVFVGSNNSGKSLVLREIEEFAENGGLKNPHIIDNLTFRLPNQDESKNLIEAKKQEPPPHFKLSSGQIFLKKLNIPGVPYSNTDEALIDTEMVLSHISRYSSGDLSILPGVCRKFIKFITVRLDGQTRLSLLNEQGENENIDLLKPPTNHLTALFQVDETREKIREIMKDAFDLYFTIDPTKSGYLRVKMNQRVPVDKDEEQSFTQRARNYHSEGTPIEDLSDGVKAFSGLVAVTMSSDFKIMLIDEAEAFLHPPLARKLGTHLSNLSSERNANIFVATHSPYFVMGCIQSGKPLNVVRLTYKNKVPSATMLKNEDLQNMMREPLLRSTGLLNALFHMGTVVTEGDSDRAFYQEVNERLNLFTHDGIEDCLFLSGIGKPTIHRIIAPLRLMGIPAAGIVDLDIIKVSDDFNKLLGSCHLPKLMHHPLGLFRKQLLDAYGELNQDPKLVGIEVLSSTHKEIYDNLENTLSKYGIFIVKVGQLERWMKSLKLSSSNKRQWIVNMFEKMGSDPKSSDYIKPDSNDVWDFIRKIQVWINNPKRLGMP